MCSVSECESYINLEEDEISISISNVSDHVREDLWNRYGPEYFTRLDENELKQAISESLTLDHEEVFETVEDHLEDKGILVKLEEGYGVNMAEQP